MQVLMRHRRNPDLMEWSDADSLVGDWMDSNFKGRVEDALDDAVTDKELVDDDKLLEKLDELRDEIRNGDLTVSAPDTLSPDVRAEVTVMVAEMRHELRRELLDELQQRIVSQGSTLHEELREEISELRRSTGVDLQQLRTDVQRDHRIMRDDVLELRGKLQQPAGNLSHDELRKLVRLALADVLQALLLRS